MSRTLSVSSLGSSALVVAALVGCNSAPIAPVIAIEPQAPTTTDDFELVFLARSEDPDLADSVTYQIRWYQDDEEVTELADALTVDAERTSKNEQWVVQVVPVDSDGEVGQGAEAVVTVQNTPPTVDVEITPAEPGSYEDLTARPTGDDIDGDDVSYSYAWFRNGDPVPDESSSTLSAELTSKGELWTVQVTPSDGQDDGEIAEATVSVGNALPVATEVFIDPTVVREDTVLTARPTGTDEDDDPLTWTFTWYVNDVALPGEDGETLDGRSFDRGDRVVVEATPNDGFVDGEPVRSAPVRVRNSAPTLEGAVIDPAEAYEASTLTCLGSGFSDLDGDPEGYRTTWFVEGGRIESDTLSGDHFSKGDSVWCELAPFDGTEEGDAIRTDTLTVLNTPPVITRVTITNPTPQEGDTLEVRIEGAGDDDADSVSFEYSWTVDGTPVSTDATLSSDLFDKDQVVAVTVTPFDGEDRGTPVSSPAVTVQNTLPEMDSVVLSPTELFTNDTLTATVEASDADGDPITYSYDWVVDGVSIGASGSSLDGASWFDKDESVYVVVTPNDGDGDGAPMTSSTVRVKNTAPSISSVSITPSSFGEEDTITCVPSGWDDEDGDPESYDYAWFVDGKRVGIASTLDGDFFDRGDEVYCEVTPTDGDDDGSTVASSTLTVSNTPPTIAKVELSTTSPVEGDTVYAVIIGDDDVDGDSISFDYAWYVGGSLVSTADEIDSSLFAKGDSIYVVVTPSDDADEGVGVKSNVGTVANTAPVVSGVTFSPSAPKTNEAVTASVTSSDVDGDTVSYSFAWYVEGSKVGSSGATLATSDFKKNEDIYVIVTPTDGDDAGTPFTSSVITSVNTIPTITGVSISPSVGITETTTLTCVPAGWSDADGDTESYAYQWRVDGKLTAVSKTLTGSSFAKGDRITCTATPNDGEDLGTPLTSSVVTVANSAPSLASVTLSDSTPQEGDTLTATLGAATDADGDRISFKYAWEVNGSVVSTGTSLSGSDFDKGDTVELIVTPTDGVDDGTPVSSGIVTVQNTAPVISSVTLSPTSPQTTDSITATVSASDADGDSLSYTFVWTVNSKTVSAVGATLGSSFFSKDDTISVTVTPSDGDDSGSAVASSTITAVNTPGSISSVSLSPSSFGEGDTVTCVPAGWSDPDGDPAGYVYQWKVNGSTLSSSASTLTGSDFDKGDNVQCIVTPNDGDDLGTPVSSTVVTVGNSAPELASAAIAPTSPKEGDTLTVTLGAATDADGDPISYTYRWFAGSSVVGTGPTLTGSSFDKGDVLKVEVTPTDGIDTGTPVTSATVTVDNTAPVVSGVTLSPTTAGTDSTLTASVTASDADGDSLSYSYAWYVEGSKVSATGATLSGTTWFDKGEEVYVEVTADDGDDTSAVVSSATLTIGNTPPSITSASISPSTIREATTVSCTASGWSDPDGDSPSYRYQWTVNGAPSATTATLTGSSFKKGDSIGCKVTPYDGTDTGAAVSATTVRVLNTAPVLSSVSLSTLSPSESDTITVSLGSASDADGDSISYEYAWYVNGSLVASSTTLNGTYFKSGDTIYVKVTPTDGTDDGATVTSSTATVANTAPVISSVTLAPSSPKTNDTLTASVSASDADGDPLTYSYVWKVDGVTQSATSKTLSGVSFFDKGESVTVTVTASDGSSSVSRTSAAVSVANTPPRITSATISPSVGVREATTLTCSASGWSDADGDSAGYRYRWTVNGSAAGTASTLTGAAFDKGDSVGCQITPFDGTDTGAAVSASAVTVVNTAPVLSSVSLSTLSPSETDTITVSLGSTSDADGDSISYEYAWYVNGSLTSTATTLDGSSFGSGDSIYVEVTPTDGTDDGSAVRSSTATVTNTAPVISSVTLSPTSPRTNDTLTTSVSASDVDGDSLSYTYVWKVDGVTQSATSKSLSGASWFDKGESVTVTVTVSDGKSSVSRTSSAVIVDNTPPSLASASLSTTSPREGDTLTCTPSGWSDVDGDAPGYRYQWFDGGSPISGATSSTLSSSRFSKGDSIRCRITPWDGDDTGTAVFSPTATVLNTKPVAGGVSLSNTAPRTTQSVTATVTGVSDADGDTVNLRYQWYVGGSLRRTTTTTSTSNTLSSSEFVKNQDIYVVVTPHDGAEWGASVRSSTGRSVNTAPVISSLTLSPSTAYTTTPVSASVSASDADGDSLSYVYAWYLQNEGSGGFTKVGGSGSSLSSSSFDRDDVIYAQVTALDGETSTGPFKSSNLTIQNSRPSTPGRPSISPSSPTVSSNLRCSTSGSGDKDGDTLTYQYRWYRNGSLYGTYTSGSTSYTLSSSATSGGDVWYCRIRAYDDEPLYSSWSSSSPSVTVPANRDGQVRRTNGVWIDVTYEPCLNGCDENDAKKACGKVGGKVVSHASNGNSQVYSLGATNSCQWSISYYKVDKSMPSGSCLVGVSNMDWSGCCGTGGWHGNTVNWGSPSKVFGFVWSGNSGYTTTWGNTSGNRWGCYYSASSNAPLISGCSKPYVACTK